MPRGPDAKAGPKEQIVLAPRRQAGAVVGSDGIPGSPREIVAALCRGEWRHSDPVYCTGSLALVNLGSVAAPGGRGHLSRVILAKAANGDVRGSLRKVMDVFDTGRAGPRRSVRNAARWHRGTGRPRRSCVTGSPADRRTAWPRPCPCTGRCSRRAPRHRMPERTGARLGRRGRPCHPSRRGERPDRG